MTYTCGGTSLRCFSVYSAIACNVGFTGSETNLFAIDRELLKRIHRNEDVTDKGLRECERSREQTYVDDILLVPHFQLLKECVRVQVGQSSKITDFALYC